MASYSLLLLQAWPALICLMPLQVRTNTLVKNAIVQVDSAPFKQWYLQHYGVEVGLKRKLAATEDAAESEQIKQAAEGAEIGKKSKHVQRKLKARNVDRTLDATLDDQFATGRLFACISSRPGQCGRCDGYVQLFLFFPPQSLLCSSSQAQEPCSLSFL